MRELRNTRRCEFEHRVRLKSGGACFSTGPLRPQIYPLQVDWLAHILRAAEQHFAGDFEHRRIRSDSEGQRKNGNDAESRPSVEGPPRELEVLPGTIKKRNAAGFPNRFLNLENTAKIDGSVTLGFDEYEVGPGSSIAFDCTQPHRLANRGDEPVEAVWWVIGRRHTLPAQD